MFKRYKSPLEKEVSSFESQQGSVATQAVRHPMSRAEAPPRIFNEGNVAHSSPYSPVSPYCNAHPLRNAQEMTTEQHQPENLEAADELSLRDEEPDTTLGKGVVFKGELTFERLLRIDGQFEGELVSDGKLIIGPSGVVKSNIKMQEAIIEGKVEGNISVVKRLELRCQAEVYGDIEAGVLSVDEGVTIMGSVAVAPSKT